MSEDRSGQERTARTISLTATGVTLLGVLLSIGVTLAVSVSGSWWLRVAIGAASTLALVAAVKLTTRKGRGPLARMANWTISAPPRDEDGHG